MKISDIEKLGLYMPAEFGRHHGTIMIWPKRPGSWKKDQTKVRKIFADIITDIAEVEKLYFR